MSFSALAWHEPCKNLPGALPCHHDCEAACCRPSRLQRCAYLIRAARSLTVSCCCAAEGISHARAFSRGSRNCPQPCSAILPLSSQRCTCTRLAGSVALDTKMEVLSGQSSPAHQSVPRPCYKEAVKPAKAVLRPVGFPACTPLLGLAVAGRPAAFAICIGRQVEVQGRALGCSVECCERSRPGAGAQPCAQP